MGKKKSLKVLQLHVYWMLVESTENMLKVAVLKMIKETPSALQ